MGPIGHYIAMRSLVKAAKTLNLEFIPKAVDPITAITPDLKKISHGYDFSEGTGTLIPLIDQTIQLMLKAHANGWKDEYQAHVVNLNHYILDALTIGQICGKTFWGSPDNKFDVACELVLNKAKDVLYTDYERYGSIKQILSTITNVMAATHLLFYDDAFKWDRFDVRWIWNIFRLVRGVTPMTRRAIRLSTYLTISIMIYTFGGDQK